MDEETRAYCFDQVHVGNPRPFMENFFYISAKDNRLVPFRFNRLQEHVHNHTTDRDFWIKYRQGGSSLYHLGRFLAYCLCIPYFNAACLTLSTDKGKTAERLFRHVARMVEAMPEEARPRKGHERADGYLEFEDMQSQIYIGTVGSREFGRSETIHALMVTELGLFSPQEAHGVMTSAVESVVPGGIIVFETTPRFIGSYAHRLYMDCKAGRKPYTVGFVPWYWAEDYHLPPGSMEALPEDRGELVLTEVERKLGARFPNDGISVEERVRWRRGKIAVENEAFFAEYPEDDASCWLAATSGVFTADKLRNMLMEVRKPDAEYGLVRLYKEASPLRSYVCGVDAAGGIPGGDFSAGVVQCAETGEVVAVLHGLVGPDGMARGLAELGLRYNRMMIGGERDAWTLQVMEYLEKLGYPNLYIHDDGGKEGKLGFPNTQSLRLQAVSALRSAIAQGDWRAYDEPLILELIQYQKMVKAEGGITETEKYSAPSGLHDDLCVAAQRAQQIRLSMPVGGLLFAPREKTPFAQSLYPVGRW